MYVLKAGTVITIDRVEIDRGLGGIDIETLEGYNIKALERIKKNNIRFIQN